jgi:hypothetical protein
MLAERQAAMNGGRGQALDPSGVNSCEDAAVLALNGRVVATRFGLHFV